MPLDLPTPSTPTPDPTPFWGFRRCPQNRGTSKSRSSAPASKRVGSLAGDRPGFSGQEDRPPTPGILGPLVLDPKKGAKGPAHHLGLRTPEPLSGDDQPV